MSENVLYSDIRAEAFEILATGEIPKTLIFAGGSAYCMDLYKCIYETIIPNIDMLINKPDATPYDRKMMRSSKDRLSQLIFALKNKQNWDIDVKEWNEEKLAFSSYKLSN
jgi:hypothetical protein